VVAVETPVGVLEDGTVYYSPLGQILRDGDDLGATGPATTCSPSSTGSDNRADTRDVNKTRSPLAPGSTRAL